MKKFLRLFGFILRILFFYSDHLKSIAKVFIFPNILDSQETVKENEFIFSYFSRPFFSENYISV